METSELSATAFCTRCGQPLLNGNCPNGPHQAAPTSAAADPPHGAAAILPDRRPSWGTAATIAAMLVATLAVAITALALAVQTRRSLADTRAALDESSSQQRQFKDRLEELDSTSQDTRAALKQFQVTVDKRADNPAVVKAAARSVFTVVTTSGSGSGFVVGNHAGRAQLITNFHVVADGYVNGDLDVSIRQGRLSYPGRVVDVSESNDIALISVRQELPALPVAQHRPAVGAPLLVLGSPLGLGGTVTSGIASAFRTEDGLTYMQFSAPISPGNSGGPLLDERGRVVGVAVSKIVGSGAEGLGFAIPSSRLCTALPVC